MCNTADAGTKYLDATDMERQLKMMGFIYLDGGSAIALKAAV